MVTVLLWQRSRRTHRHERNVGQCGGAGAAAVEKDILDLA
jgi:hypothetical protein